MHNEPTSRRTILVVDDERGPRESLKMALAANHAVIACASGAEALRILGASSIDLLTVDLDMPGMRGDELIRRVRDKYPQIEIIVVTGGASVEGAVEALRHQVSDYLAKPFDVGELRGAVTRALGRQHDRQRLLDLLDVAAPVDDAHSAELEPTSEQPAPRTARERLLAVVDAAELPPAPTSVTGAVPMEFLETLAEVVESRDRCMHGHSRRVAFFAGLLAERIGLDVEQCEEIRISAFLHDLGKAGVPLELVEAPGRLFAHQRERVRHHPAIGARLVQPLGLARGIATAIRHHHERWDGEGYPDGLLGADIPRAARIIAVVDAFDAMTCDRPYGARFDFDEAIVELRKHAGSQLDPQFVESFASLIESGTVDASTAVAPRPTSRAAEPMPGAGALR